MPKTDSKRISRKVKNLTGRKFNRLLVIGFSRMNDRNQACWHCLCDCGNLSEVVSSKLISGWSKSCGCLKVESLVARSLTHGMSGTSAPRIYGIWTDMRARCLNTNHHKYPGYGGRGIKICQRWDSFASFYEDMSDPPTAQHSPDRIDNDGNYSCGKCLECLENGWPMNVRWATRIQQSRNKRNNRLLTANGETLCIAEWAERDSTPSARTIWKRLDRGWSVNEALGFVQRT